MKKCLYMPSKRVCCPGPLASRLSGVTPPRFLKSGRCAVAYIAAESEVSEKRGNVALAKPRAQTRVQPQRVMEVAAGKRDQRMCHPYDPKKNKGKGSERPRETNRPPRYEFVILWSSYLLKQRKTPRMIFVGYSRWMGRLTSWVAGLGLFWKDPTVC